MPFASEILFLLAILTAFVIVNVSIPSIIKVSHEKNLFDVPDHRKSHKNSIPALGGLAIFAGFMTATLLYADFQKTLEFKFILASIILIFFIGLKDDILVIAPDKKLIVQVVAAVIIVYLGDVRLTNLQGFLGIREIPEWVSIGITLFVIIVVLNGMNLIDGIDGLASGIGILTSGTMAVWFYLQGMDDYVIIIASLIGALAAFFRFNVFGLRNKIFMGDTGSLILGLLMAVFAVKFNESNLYATDQTKLISAPSVSIGILIIPLFDTIRVFTIRILNGRSPFSADKNHVHHRLLDIGFSHIQATGIILMVNMIFIAASFFFDFMGNLKLFLILFICATVLSFIPVYIVNRRKKKAEEEEAVKSKISQDNSLNVATGFRKSELRKDDVDKNSENTPKQPEKGIVI